MRNTLWLVVVIVTLRMVFGLVVAMLVIRLKRGGGFFRTLYYAPYLAPPVAGTIAFVFLLNPGTGAVNTVLGRLGLPQPGWFNDPAWSKPSLTLLALWCIGDLMVIFMASLLDVPRDLYEAAELDGAGAFARFRFVTLPFIQPILVFAAVTGVIAMIAVLHRAAGRWTGRQRADRRLGSRRSSPAIPDGSTLTLPQLVYNLGFQRFDIGAACVIALVLFVFSMVFAALLMRRGSGFLAED